MAMLLVLLICSGFLIACNGGEDGGVATSGNETEQPGDETTGGDSGDGSLVIIDNKLSEYTLMRGDKSSQDVTDALVSINKAINAAYGVSLNVKTDWAKGLSASDIVENDEKEILIGDCNRKETKEVLATLGDNQYAIRVVGKKLVIVGDSDYTTVNAVNEFISTYLKKSGTTLSIPADTSITGKGGIQKVTLTAGADIRVMTFNILGTSENFAERKKYEVQAILDHLPDVIGFQEASPDTHTQVLFNTSVKKYYEINAKYHANNSTANYTPILFLKDKYKLIEGGVEFLRSRYERTNTKSLSWAVLEVKETGKRFIVANLHGALWVSNSYILPEGETDATMVAKAVLWRVDNAKQMLEKIDELKAKYGDLPVVTTGDYNFTSSTDAYKTIIAGGLVSSQEKASISATKGIKSTHAVGSAPASGSNIDHIFYNESGFSALKYVISTRPDDLKASDHCPVFADLKFK